MAFQGSLAELHLPDIIQLISVSGKTGVFHLTDGGPARARSTSTTERSSTPRSRTSSGEEAVYALAIWSQGDFKFEPGVATEVRTISKSNTNLLMEAARRLDEWRVLSKKIPATEMIPEFVVQDNREGQISLNTERVADPLEDRRPAQHQGHRRTPAACRSSTPRRSSTASSSPA